MLSQNWRFLTPSPCRLFSLFSKLSLELAPTPYPDDILFGRPQGPANLKISRFWIWDIYVGMYIFFKALNNVLLFCLGPIRICKPWTPTALRFGWKLWRPGSVLVSMFGLWLLQPYWVTVILDSELDVCTTSSKAE